jgi:hypothetical protein
MKPEWMPGQRFLVMVVGLLLGLIFANLGHRLF